MTLFSSFDLSAVLRPSESGDAADDVGVFVGVDSNGLPLDGGVYVCSVLVFLVHDQVVIVVLRAKCRDSCGFSRLICFIFRFGRCLSLLL